MTKAEGPPVVYKDEGDIMLAWKVEGKNMYYTHPRFIPLYGCAANPPVNGGSMRTDQTFSDKYLIYVPLSLLPHGCTYTIALVTPCEELKVIGSVTVELTH